MKLQCENTETQRLFEIKHQNECPVFSLFSKIFDRIKVLFRRPYFDQVSVFPSIYGWIYLSGFQVKKTPRRKDEIKIKFPPN